MLICHFYNHLDIYDYVGKLPEQHFSVFLFFNPGDKILFLLQFIEARISEWNIIYLTFFFSHYFLIIHILLHDKVCRLHNFVILAILKLIFGAAFITVLFTCFINVIVYFISISEYLVTIISPKLCVLNLDKFFQPTFDCKNTQAYTFS